jgi:hypothetical protein
VHHPALLAMRCRQQLANCCLPSPPGGCRQTIAAAAGLVVLVRANLLQFMVRAQVSALSLCSIKHVRQVKQNTWQVTQARYSLFRRRTFPTTADCAGDASGWAGHQHINEHDIAVTSLCNQLFVHCIADCTWFADE